MKYLLLTMTLLTAVLFAACAPLAGPSAPETVEPTQPPVSDTGDEAEVRGLVESFGERLKMVSLLAPEAAQDVQTQYAELVSPTLLETWTSDVSNAPGRMVSSPWPDRIEITALEQEAADRYVVEGSIIEITSTEIGSEEAAHRIPVRIVAEKVQGHWLITEYAEEN